MFSHELSNESGPALSRFPNAADSGGKSGSFPLLEYTRPSYDAHSLQVVPWLLILYKSHSGSWVSTDSTSACLDVVRRTILP